MHVSELHVLLRNVSAASLAAYLSMCIMNDQNQICFAERSELMFVDAVCCACHYGHVRMLLACKDAM